jgi:hypothetical protein
MQGVQCVRNGAGRSIAEVSRDSHAGRVSRVAADLDPLDGWPGQGERRERAGAFACIAMAGRAAGQPIPQFERTLANARMEPAPAQQRRPVTGAKRVDPRRTVPEVGDLLRDPFLERLTGEPAVDDPGSPGAQVRVAVRERVSELRRVIRSPRSQAETRSIEVIGRADQRQAPVCARMRL